MISGADLPERYGSKRVFCTAIYYIITEGEFSAVHRIKSDEIFHFYLGDPVLLLKLYPDGSGETIKMGNDILNGQILQCQVPAGVWMGLKLFSGGKYCLMGTTVSPGFEFNDLEFGKRYDLTEKYPDYTGLICEMTKNQ